MTLRHLNYGALAFPACVTVSALVIGIGSGLDRLRKRRLRKREAAETARTAPEPESIFRSLTERRET